MPGTGEGLRGAEPLPLSMEVGKEEEETRVLLNCLRTHSVSSFKTQFTFPENGNEPLTCCCSVTKDHTILNPDQMGL